MSKGWAEEAEVMFPFLYEGPHHVLVCVNLCEVSLVLANLSRYHLKHIEPSTEEQPRHKKDDDFTKMENNLTQNGR